MAPVVWVEYRIVVPSSSSKRKLSRLGSIASEGISNLFSMHQKRIFDLFLFLWLGSASGTFRSVELSESPLTFGRYATLGKVGFCGREGRPLVSKVCTRHRAREKAQLYKLLGPSLFFFRKRQKACLREVRFYRRAWQKISSIVMDSLGEDSRQGAEGNLEQEPSRDSDSPH